MELPQDLITQFELPKLNQIIIEEKFARNNIREKILMDILCSSNNTLKEPINKAIKEIEIYLDGAYYESKEERLDVLRKERAYIDWVIEILIIVLPEQNRVPIQNIVGKFANRLKHKDPFDRAKTAAELIAVVCRADLYDIYPATQYQDESPSMLVHSKYSLEKETLDYIEQTKFLPPLICPPLTVSTNTDSGYLTLQQKKEKKSIILGRNNHHNKHQALDVINIVNSVAFSIDPRILQYNEESKKPLDTDTKEKNFKHMVNQSNTVYTDLVDQGNKFWFCHSYDKRGRLYCNGWYIGTQAGSYKKALLELSHKVIIPID